MDPDVSNSLFNVFHQMEQELLKLQIVYLCRSPMEWMQRSCKEEVALQNSLKLTYGDNVVELLLMQQIEENAHTLYAKLFFSRNKYKGYSKRAKQRKSCNQRKVMIIVHLLNQYEEKKWSGRLKELTHGKAHAK
ncbi:hypothetical protein ACFE04_026796 [Oxalis oulophora]